MSGKWWQGAVEGVVFLGGGSSGTLLPIYPHFPLSIPRGRSGGAAEGLALKERRLPPQDCSAGSGGNVLKEAVNLFAKGWGLSVRHEIQVGV